MHRRVAPAFALVLSIAATTAPAQTVRLVKDINAIALPDPQSDPVAITPLGHTTVFVADYEINRVGFTALWATDGTPDSITILGPPEIGSRPIPMARAGNRAFFVGRAYSTSAKHLWVTDGTVAGTQILTATRAQFVRSERIFGVGTNAFFASGPPAARNLSFTDGTIAGTRVVFTFSPQSLYFNTPTPLATGGSTLYFGADDGSTGFELWKSNGTAEGTAQVANIAPGSQSSNPTAALVMGNTVFFVANDGSTGAELWKTDGTPAGTSLVRDIRPGATGSDPDQLTSVGGLLYFVADDGSSGRELWKSDGTGAGTVQVADIAPGAEGSDPDEVTGLGSILCLTANDRVRGRELWRSDGSAAGTTLVREIAPGPQGSLPHDLTAVGSLLYFGADDGVAGDEPYFSDGTISGTQRLADVQPGAGSSAPDGFAPTGDSLVFAADDGVHGRELWVSDGTTAGTAMLANLRQGALSEGSSPTKTVDLNGIALFGANDSIHGAELWRSDGTAAGTWMVKDLNPTGHSWPCGESGAGGNRVAFTASLPQTGNELWMTDGTAAGTTFVADVEPGPLGSEIKDLTALDGQFYFTATTTAFGHELWRSDGSPGGTQPVIDLNPGAANAEILFLTLFRNGLAFAATRPDTGSEVWISDGTAQGTRLLIDLEPGPGGANILGIAARGNELFFIARTTAEGRRLWASDGTAQGTAPVPGLPGPGQIIRDLLATPGPVYAVVDNQILTTKWLWRIDGRLQNATLLATLAGSASTLSIPREARVAPFGTDGIAFLLNPNPNGSLVFSDGTVGGTTSVLPTTANSITTLKAAGTRHTMFVESGDPGISDGTSAGTKLINPNPGSFTASSNSVFRLIGGQMFFTATDPKVGSELWVYDPGATTQVLLLGCGCTVPPVLRADDPVLGAVTEVRGASSEPNSTAALLLGTTMLAAPLSGATCALILAPGSIAVLTAAPTGSGAWSAPLALPPVPALTGLRVGLQAVVLNPSCGRGYDLTNGLALTLGS